MGIVRKQSTYSTIFTYLGFAVGALNIIILFPTFFSKEEFGLTRLIGDFAMFFSALATMGTLNGLYKFNPFYKDYLPAGKNDLPFLTVVLNVIGAVLFVIAALVFEPYLERQFGNNSPLFVANYRLVIPYTVSYTCLMVLEAFCWTIKKTIISTLVKELFYRFTTTVLIFLYVLHWITLDTFFLLFSLSYIPALLILIFVIYQNGGITLYYKISSTTRRLYKKILVFISYHYSGLLISILPRAVDGILIARLTDNGLQNLAVYSIPVYLVTIMEVPQRSMQGIATTLIAEAWKNKDRGKIEELYKKSSINLLVLGLGILGLMLPNMDNLIRFNPDYQMAKAIFIVAAIAKIIDLGMGMNAQILSLSKFWRTDFYSSAIFIFVNIALDYFMIKRYGVIGAAYGSGIALIFYNLLRYTYLWFLFKMQPFTLKTLYVLLIAGMDILIVWQIPLLDNLYIDTIMRCFVFVLLYLPAILYFQISTDITEMFWNFANKVGLKKKY
ncbi:MAG TPA: polysaccharide biosynthesis C-terminal domain-containing protein [Arachidicoccus sp.]|nr:polysaccharide biosynthesis C-terminal domain-containing protein [Arachidicoccus sp.]